MQLWKMRSASSQTYLECQIGVQRLSRRSTKTSRLPRALQLGRARCVTATSSACVCRVGSHYTCKLQVTCCLWSNHALAPLTMTQCCTMLQHCTDDLFLIIIALPGGAVSCISYIEPSTVKLTCLVEVSCLIPMFIFDIWHYSVQSILKNSCLHQNSDNLLHRFADCTEAPEGSLAGRLG